MAAHKFMAATDKDLEPIFEKMCRLVTVDLFLMAADTSGLEDKYEDDI